MDLVLAEDGVVVICGRRGCGARPSAFGDTAEGEPFRSPLFQVR